MKFRANLLIALFVLTQVLHAAPVVAAETHGRSCSVPAQNEELDVESRFQRNSGIGGTGNPAATESGIGGTGSPAGTNGGIGGTGTPVAEGQGIGGTGMPAAGIGGTGMHADGSGGIGGTGIKVAGVLQDAVGTIRAIDHNNRSYILNKGSNICPGDRIETGARATAKIAFQDGTMLFVRDLTRLAIDQYAWDESDPDHSKFTISLIDGGVRSVSGKLSKHNPDAYRLTAPHASISVLGTDYQVMLVNTRQGETEPGMYASVSSGQIRLDNSLGSLILKAGEAAAIKLNSSPVKLRSWPGCLLCH